MADKKIISGIDVGTTKIVAIIAEYDDKLSVLKKYFADSKKKEVLNG